MATPSSILAWKIPWTESDMTEQLNRDRKKEFQSMDQRSHTWNFLMECQCNLHIAGWAVREGILLGFEAELRSLSIEEELA